MRIITSIFFTQKKMLETLTTSKTSIKLLLKFLLNINNKSYLGSLEVEFNGTNGIQQELHRFERAGLLSTESDGNKKLYY